MHRGQLVTGALLLTSGTHQYYWLGVMDEQSQHLRPNNLLFSRLLEKACSSGIRTFDFGNSDGLIGVFNFKKSFGPDHGYQLDQTLSDVFGMIWKAGQTKLYVTLSGLEEEGLLASGPGRSFRGCID